ncbi:MAG TPA: hypothetical protein VIK52_07470 [Opitutaceae bacterium]|jgi:hypothetical protein
MATVIIEGAPSRARSARSFYVGVSLLIVAIVLAGFAPSFFGMAVLGQPKPWIIHVHAAVYLGWLGVLVSQAVLAARGKIAAHRRVGSFGIAYGGLVWVLGMIVTFVAPALHVRAGEWDMDRAATFLTLPLGDMVLFAGFFGAAVGYRHKPEIHKRLILLACVAIMFAGVARLSYVVSQPVQVVTWYLPVLAAMAYDRYRIGRVHPVYWIGVAIMAVALARIPFGETELWRGIGRAMLAPFV